MTIGAGHFHAGNNVKRICALLAVGPQARVDAVMIGDGDDVQVTPPRRVIKHLSRCRSAVTRRRVHVQIGAACKLRDVHVPTLYQLNLTSA